eukprot:CAMPEP_0171058468 /NCGR_PEP_ID=MMETSP0766_2-20121228/2510_1 /TAXON_ID=439317 /ORGANISM="Gambierdiscus australes, Strain CAWD 149" /LENGTH=770 /DNA_ID=CAMNT_0011513745 /DNA_START=177 /DNA_END=2489 /DNA_ORIENTATION=-
MSGERYQRYSKATTVGEALALGSKPEDFLNDLSKGILKVKGPVREQPLGYEELHRVDGLTDTDRAFAKFGKGFHRQELASQLGMDAKTAAAKRSWCESPVMHVKRLVAERMAEEFLANAEKTGEKVADSQVLSLMRQWSFRRNTARKVVAPDNMPIVDSDTFGIMRNQAGVWIITHATRDYPAVTRLLTRWLRDSLPVQDFACTSIHVNSGFAARRHRDRDNHGPTVVRALGDVVSGGQLWYWPEDDGVGALEQLPEDARVSLDVHAAAAVIDGNRAHEVEPFEGERFGLVFYTISNCDKIPKEMREELIGFGFEVPDKEAIDAATACFTPPRGYGLPPAPVAPPKKPDHHKKPKALKKGEVCPGKLLLAKLTQNASVRETAKEKPKGGLLKQMMMKAKAQGQPKESGGSKKRSGGRRKGKVVFQSGILNQTVDKDESIEDSAAAAGTPPAEAEPLTATTTEAADHDMDSSVDERGTGQAKPSAPAGKMLSAGLLARVIAAKRKAADKEPKRTENCSETPQRKKPLVASAAPSAKKTKTTTRAAEGTEAGKAVAMEPEAKPSPAESKVKKAGDFKEALQAVALEYGIGAEAAGREQLLCHHFLPLASALRLADQNPEVAAETLARYFGVVLRLSEQPEQLLRSALELLQPASAVPEEQLAAAVTEAFGPAAARAIEEKGLPEAALEGRRCKRSLRAPPPRLTLEAAAAALEAGCDSEGRAKLVHALVSTRIEGDEALVLTKMLQGEPGLSSSTVNAAVARALVRAGHEAC